jgi:hypothetical protein
MSTTTYRHPNLASFAAMASALALTSFSLTVGPNESQLFQPMGGVGASMVPAAAAALDGDLQKPSASRMQMRIRKADFIGESLCLPE